MEPKKRVLIFEDEAPLRDLFGFVIKNNGCDVSLYESPIQFPIHQCNDCLKNGDKRCADILLTDMTMPKVSGLDFIEDRLSKGCKISQIGIISGVLTDENISRAKKLGCTVLEKPISITQLVRWLNKCINKLD